MLTSAALMSALGAEMSPLSRCCVIENFHERAQCHWESKGLGVRQSLDITAWKHCTWAAGASSGQVSAGTQQV